MVIGHAVAVTYMLNGEIQLQLQHTTECIDANDARTMAIADLIAKYPECQILAAGALWTFKSDGNLEYING